MWMRMLKLVLLSLIVLAGCGEAGVDTVSNDGLETVTAFEGTSGDYKGDAPNAVSRWEILRADESTLVLHALDGKDRIYLEAWVQDEGTTLRVDYVVPVQCAIVTDKALGIVLHNDCTMWDSSVLGVTAVDFLYDLQSAGPALQTALQKADGFTETACVTARVVVGGLGGILTTVAVFHEAILESLILGAFGWSMGITAASVGAGVAVFAVSALGTAWAVDKACRALIEDGPSSLLTGCVAECSDLEDCVSDCVMEAASIHGIAQGREECYAGCDDDACKQECADAYGDENMLRQTLLSQCAMGCSTSDATCGESCVDAINVALPH